MPIRVPQSAAREGVSSRCGLLGFAPSRCALVPLSPQFDCVVDWVLTFSERNTVDDMAVLVDNVATRHVPPCPLCDMPYTADAADDVEVQRRALSEFWRVYSSLNISHAQHAQFIQALKELEVTRQRAGDQWALKSVVYKCVCSLLTFLPPS